jgi:exopolysaccharide production protein ExoQ
MSRAKAPLGERLERYLFVFILLYAAGALVQLAIQGPVPLRGTMQQDSVPLRAVWAVCYLFVFGLVLTHIRLYTYVLREQPALVTLALVMLISASWSAEPAVSIQHAATAVITMAIGVYLGLRYGAEGVVRLLAIALAIAMVTSLLVMTLMPRWGTMVLIHPGAWLGVFSHKNALGMMSLLSILCFAYLARGAMGWPRRCWQGLIGVALILLLGAGSATAILGLPLLAAGASGLKLFRRSKTDIMLAMTGFAAAVFGAIPLLLITLGAILRSFGRDLTFTGRTDLWRMGFESALHRPLLGYGFDSFWDDHSAYGGAQIRAYLDWAAPHVHNSWLELSLGVGLLGLCFFAIVLGGTFMRAITLLRRRGAGIDGFVALFMLYLGLYSFDEQVFLVRNDVLTILLTAFATASLVDLRALRAQPEAEPDLVPVRLAGPQPAPGGGGINRSLSLPGLNRG